jgi:sugar (pentulose or hexulose) kinase
VKKMQEVILIFDIGKTNKKCLVFDTNGKVIDEYAEQFVEITDEDNFLCDDLQALEKWVLGQYELLQKNETYKIIAINFATYGASLVHVNADGKPLTALYNYLKPIPKNVTATFVEKYFKGDESVFATTTSSPFMGMLNSGLQLYWLKQTKPQIWEEIKYSLHLPQYLSYLFTKEFYSDYTSIGCHTGLWDSNKNKYAQWVLDEYIHFKLARINDKAVVKINTEGIKIGLGLHDSSSALIPYLKNTSKEFLLISTGTWCINLNPFNFSPLTAYELSKDCLQFLQANGKPVKASRIFLGKEHQYQAERIATHFNVAEDFYKDIALQITDVTKLNFIPACMEGSGPLPQKQTQQWDLSIFDNEAEAYNYLMLGLVTLLQLSINLVDTVNVTQFFIDGGFAANKIFLALIQQFNPTKKVDVVDFPQATALGAYLQVVS